MSALVTALQATLESISTRLDANPPEPEKSRLLSTSNTLMAILAQATLIELKDAAKAVTGAAIALQAVIDGSGGGPIPLPALETATSNLRKVVTAVVAPTSAATTTSTTTTAGTVAGIDCALDCTVQAPAIAAAGKTFVVRYFRNGASSFPRLKASEAQALSAAGLKVVSIWESASDKPSHFSRTTGLDEGSSAYTQALAAGQPAGTPIYFAVDFDCNDNQLASGIHDYFQAIASIFDQMGHGASAYKVGVYGSGRACRWLKAQGLATYTWVALSHGWAEFGSFTDWNIKQGANDHVLPFDYDVDLARGDFGAFTV